jgi:citryl-CoA synthetase large subunit
MILYEFEGKKLLMHAGVDIPQSQLVGEATAEIILQKPYVLKAQVLSGKRADVGGIVMIGEDQDETKELSDLLAETINKEKVAKVLVEQKVEYQKEFYVAISYDTELRAVVLNISDQGGTGIEEREIKTFEIDALNPHGVLSVIARSASDVAISNNSADSGQARMTIDTDLAAVLEKLINLFFDQDCLLLEVNPLVLTTDNRWVALDAKVKLDDYAKPRHEDWDFLPRSAPGHNPTDREIEAKKIDENDYRGTAGSAYFDIEGGDIAVLSSGGGVSLTALDSLIALGGKPANFTEYSGNPPKEKVAKLTKIVLDKPDMHGLWVIGTVVANFTDIHETLSGLIEGLRQAEIELDRKFDFPIVIRRGGPKDEEAFAMLREVKDFDLHLQGIDVSITESAKTMIELAKDYAQKQEEITV